MQHPSSSTRPAGIAVLSALAVLAAPTVMAQQPADRFDGVRAYIEKVIEENDIPSVSVAVVKDGEIVWDEGFGWANLEQHIPATSETMYSLASISKPMTATALMQLVEQGRVELDRPANDYLGEARIHSTVWDASQATVERVFSHTAGLPLHWEFFYEGESHPRRTTDEGIARFGVLVTPPGDIYQYSNLGYGIIERIVELETGRDYAEYMRTEVFEPLGMHHSTVSTGAGLGDRGAVRYDSHNQPIPYYDFDHRGASAVYASAKDLVRFGAFHLGEDPEGGATVLEDATILAMQQSRTPTSGFGYGLGWAILADDNGYRRVSHNGGMPGVSTGLNLFPEEDVAIAVLTNRSNRYIGPIGQEIAAVMLPGYAQTLREREAVADEEGSDGADGFDPPPVLLGQWAGEVHAVGERVPITLEVKPDGDVHVRLGDQMATLVNDSHWSDGQLMGRFAGIIPGVDTGQHTHVVQLGIYLRNGRLAGSATAITVEEPAYFALTAYVELEKALTRAPEKEKRAVHE